MADDIKTETPSAPAKPASPRALLKQLQQEFPVLAECRPLAIGIDKQLLAARPETDRKLLRIALGMHTHSMRYLKALQGGSQRFNLQGEAAGEVTEEQRTLAGQALLEHVKKQAQARKAEKAAAEAAEKEARAERQRADKLQQLVGKFSRK